jgi:hypothetical protein
MMRNWLVWWPCSEMGWRGPGTEMEEWGGPGPETEKLRGPSWDGVCSDEEGQELKWRRDKGQVLKRSSDEGKILKWNGDKRQVLRQCCDELNIRTAMGQWRGPVPRRSSEVGQILKWNGDEGQILKWNGDEGQKKWGPDVEAEHNGKSAEERQN